MIIYKQLLSTTFLIGVILSAFGQVPGYAGKRFSVHAGMGINPALYEMYYDNNDFEPITSIPAVGLNVTPAFSAEYALSKGVIVGSGFMANLLNNTLTFFPDSRGGYVDYTIHGYLGETKVNSKFWNVYFKFYRYQKNGSIAPIGRFHQFEFIRAWSKLKNGDVVLTNADIDAVDKYLGYASDNYYGFDPMFVDLDMLDDVTKIGLTDPVKDIYLKYAYGFETVLNDKIAVTMSAQAAYRLSKLMGEDLDYGSPEYIYVNEIQNRAFGAFSFSMNFGIGYFLF